MNKKIFPKNFFWGASTAGHQVEGGNLNQWSVWELAHASELAKKTERRSYAFAPQLKKLPIWKDIKDKITQPENYVSANGVEHYTRFREDFDIAKSLNLNAFRFGIEWARIEPEEGVWDEQAIEHYREYISELKKRGMEPFINLWHWTNPIWFEEKGGWTKHSNLKYFDRFVQKVADTLCENITYVLTINEPNTYMSSSFILGTYPPGRKNPLLALLVNYNLLVAHRRAYKILKQYNPATQVGVANSASLNKPVHRVNPFEKFFGVLNDYIWQNWLYNRIGKDQDFIGMNFYLVHHIDLFRIKDPPKPLNDLGWYMEPGMIGVVAQRLYKKHKRPIFITENGVADMHDQYRKWWIEETIKGMEEAIDSGVELKGYFYWSLLDNFEWAEGWWPKFGLVEVDREHDMKRTIRPSAKWFAKKIKELQQD